VRQLGRAFQRAHWRAEGEYLGDGMWARRVHAHPPPVRYTSRRVLGYLRAARVDPEPIYSRRAREGLDYLVRIQQPNGHWPWYRNSFGGIRDTADALYETGIAGRALLEGYLQFGEPEYLAASERAAVWAAYQPVSENTNYNMFAVWHLAAHYAVTGERMFLEAAIHKTRHSAMAHQRRSGSWAGHNRFIWYHSIIVRGMASLWRVLPEAHPFRAELTSCLVRAVNRYVRDQRPDGFLPAEPASASTHEQANSHVLDALLTADPIFAGALARVIFGVLRHRLRLERRWPGISRPQAARMQAAHRRRYRRLIASAATARRVPAPELRIDRFRRDPTWGTMPAGWFPCWYPMYDPDPRWLHWHRKRLSRPTRYAIEYRLRFGLAFSGPAVHLRSAPLRPGRLYSLRARVKVTESADARGTVQLLWFSAYEHAPDPVWEPARGPETAYETPTPGRWQELRLDWVARRADPGVYIMMQTGPILGGEQASLLIDRVELFELGRGPDEPRPTRRAPVLDTSMQALGHAMLWAAGKQDIPGWAGPST